ncbi:MAG TPA: GNAT family N-acetyltransferase [Gemmatimonadaceae bacterium]|nr:GNAT family N-acetyltransferase [Gemmatimonadaceae bacterium]
MTTRGDARLTIRQATVADLPHVVELRLALLREHARNPIYRRLRPDAAERAERLYMTQLQSSSETMFLAERGTEVVGLLRCVVSAGSPLLVPAQYAYVSSVYVVPRARQSGVLHALLGAAETWCAERGLTEMRLHNAADNPIAGEVWERLGFEVVEELRVRQLPLHGESGIGQAAAKP